MRRLAGGRADRPRPRRSTLRFDGRGVAAHPGDTLASALLANGRRLVGRSFKYHRPRGVVDCRRRRSRTRWSRSGGGRGRCRTRARRCRRPSTGWRRRARTAGRRSGSTCCAVNDLVAPLIGAGFYYKTFMWPRRFWERVYEPLIRRAAGLGRLSGRAGARRLREGLRLLRPPGHRRRAGRADGGADRGAGRRAGDPRRRGLPARRAAPRRADGGRRAARRATGPTGWSAELAAMPNVRLMTRTTVTGVYDGGTFGALERVAEHVAAPPDRRAARLLLAHRRRGAAVLATGAIERLVAFPDNDRPGVMLAGAVRAYLNRWAVAPRRAVVFTDQRRRLAHRRRPRRRRGRGGGAGRRASRRGAARPGRGGASPAGS